MVVVVMDKHSSRTEHSDREHGGANANQWQIDRSSEAESPWSLVHSEPFIVAVDAVKSFVNDLRAKNRTRQQLGVVSTVAPRPIFPKITLSSEKAQQKQQEDHAKLNRLVNSGDLDLSNDRVLRAYLRTIRSAKDPATVRGDSAAIANHLQNGKINLSEPRLAEVFLGHSRSELSIGIPEAVDAGKIDFSNEKIVELFLDSINDLSPDSTSALTASGIPAEKIMSNAHIQRVAIGELSRRIHAAKDQDNDNGFSKRPSSTDEADDSYCLGVLDKLCTTKEGEQHLLALAGSARVSIQGLGDYCSSKELNSVDGSVGKYASRVINDEPSASLVKRNDTLKKLGWEPFKDDTSLAELFDSRSAKRSNSIQRRANQLGLITPEITDRLYTYQYHKLLNKAKKGEVDSETFGYTIDPDLTPSGNDPIANYWYEQSKLAGGDAMRLCMEYTSDAIQNYDIPDTSEFIKEDGTMQDAFFRNRKGSLLQNIYASPAIYNNNKKEEIMKLLEAHENQTSEADGSKAMINMLSKMKDEDGKYDIEAMRQLQWHIGRFCTETPDKLFDDGRPTDEFYSLAFKQSFHGEKYTDKFMSYIDSDWKDHYGDTGRKYLELVSTYPSRSDAFSDEHTEWIKNYLDAGGPTNELFDEILLDRDNITIFGKHPEWQSKLADDKKSLVKFCEECNLSGYSIREYGLTADNLSEYFDADGPTSKMKEKILLNKVELLYQHPELQEGLSAEQKSMVKFYKEYDSISWTVEEYGLTADNLSEYFDADGPTSKMKEKILFNNVGVLRRHPELQEGLSAEQKSMVKFCEECNLNEWDIEEYGLTADNLPEHFDANGPMLEFLQKIFLDGEYDVTYKYYQSQDEAGRKRMGLDDKWLAIIDGYSSVGEGSHWNSPHNIFGKYVSSHYDELTAEQIRWTANIITRLANSNASELSERSEAFAGELLKLDSDKIPEALTRIEDIYIHNHLPYVGKNYLVFRIMHPSDNLEEDFSFSPYNKISPVLQQATGDLRSGKLDQMLNSRDAIIVSDLLRASLGSNNRSIREYLDTLKNGQTLLDQLSSGELDWNAFNQPTNLMDKDTKTNYDTLSTFAWHLATIYNSTLPGKEHPYQLIHQQSDTEEPSAQSNALQTDFTNLTSLIKPNSRYTLADRAVRYFAHFVGIEDLAGAERYMDNVVKEADARNRRTAEYLATTSDPKLQPGDLVKGMGGTDGYGIRYLSYAFQNGSISKEYLGDSSRSDTTPLDIDLSVVLNYSGDTRTIDHAMRPMLADGYGCGLWTVLRSDEATGEDRFIVTRRNRHEADQDIYDPDDDPDSRHKREALTKLEAFATGVDGYDHYGIRTGFGMNKVDYCVTDSTRIDSTPVSEVTKLEIALDGFYIPIVDKDSEELIFTPADYDKMREQMSGLSHYSTGDYVFAPDSELELGELTLDKESLSAVSMPSSSSAGDDAQGASSGSITIPGTDTIIDQLPASMAETDRKHEVINQAIKQAITNIPELNLNYKDYLDGDLTENIVEMIDTGSTGRQTNAPGSGDFDYLARLDRSILNDPTKKQQITDALLAAFGRENDGSAIVNGNLRLKQVSIDGLAEPVDIDITFAQKTNKVQYPTDAALVDRLSNIKNQSETKYQQVLANIIYAKQFLKAAGAYKPRRSPEAKGIGGLGGVGIENWALQHGGSFKQAARDFLAVADSCSSFKDFCAHYPVWDYGENHKGIRSKPHDNFVADNMNQEGYNRMKQALRTVVG